jgi:hypothetical protein
MPKRRSGAKSAAQRIGAGRYSYRTYLIEEISHDAGLPRPQWNISVPGVGPVDAAETLAQAKVMIDHWWEQSFAGERSLPEPGKPLIEIL